MRTHLTHAPSQSLRNYPLMATMLVDSRHHGPPSSDRIVRAFFICRRYGLRSPYQGYSQIIVGETELFFACLDSKNEALYARWLKAMEVYAPLYAHHGLKVGDSPIAKVIEPLMSHLDWLESEEGGMSSTQVLERCTEVVNVLKRAMADVKKGVLASLHWNTYDEEYTWKELKGRVQPKDVPPRKRKRLM